MAVEPTATPSPLRARIESEIRERGPIPFARFMELALHDPVDGYYARGASRLGREGDFYTASDVGRAFGRCLARQLLEMDGALGRPDRFAVLEHGGGRGLLARDVLDAARTLDPGFAERLDYVVVDSSQGMREACRRNAPDARVVAPGDAGTGHVGCAVGVEVLDALPVHRVRRRGGRLVEIFVDLDPGGRLVEREGAPTEAARVLAERYGAAPRDDDEAEVAPGAGPLLAGMAGALERGFVLVVDYGHEAHDLYGPARRRGTLLAYHRHATNEEYLERVGEQDLTAHVNFTQVRDEARRLGLEPLAPLTTQDRFLVANGILASFEDDDPDAWARPDRVRERLRAMQLIHPDGMGRTFKVLVLSRGIAAGTRLEGLRDPFR